MFSDYNKITLELTNKNIKGKSLNTKRCKLKSTLVNSLRVEEGISKEKKSVKMNENGNKIIKICGIQPKQCGDT